jgi:transcriptional regulator with XRE-family HTH domain
MRRNRELGRKAATLIVDRIRHPKSGQEPLSVAEAAKQLGVSRMAVYNVLNRRSCPSLSLVSKVCQAWDVKFEHGGMLIEKGIFAPETSSPETEDRQMPLELVEAIQRIDHRNFEIIEAKPAGREVTITLRLTIPA